MKPNVLLCGKTGAGKTSLLNFIFQNEAGTVGTKGESETRGIKLYKTDTITINIYDSEGYEIGPEKQHHYNKLIFDFLQKPDHAAAEKPHIVWYVVSAAGGRFEDIDNQLINKIKDNNYPVCVLLTKIDELNEEKLNKILQYIKKEQESLSIFKLSNDEDIQAYCDWKALLEWTKLHIPKETHKSFALSIKPEYLLAQWFTAAGLDITGREKDNRSYSEKVMAILPRL